MWNYGNNIHSETASFFEHPFSIYLWRNKIKRVREKYTTYPACSKDNYCKVRVYRSSQSYCFLKLPGADFVPLLPELRHLLSVRGSSPWHRQRLWGGWAVITVAITTKSEVQHKDCRFALELGSPKVLPRSEHLLSWIRFWSPVLSGDFE